jgi:hypothetical protein
MRESALQLTARALSQPEVRAARTIQRFEGDSLDINACADELRELVAEVQAGGMKRPEAMLVAQAHTLDALFSSLALRSHANSREGYRPCLDDPDRRSGAERWPGLIQKGGNDV